MASSPDDAQAIGFSPDGEFLEIHNVKILEDKVLGKYFRHQNVGSFIRQLNNYGFKTYCKFGASDNC